MYMNGSYFFMFCISSLFCYSYAMEPKEKKSLNINLSSLTLTVNNQEKKRRRFSDLRSRRSPRNTNSDEQTLSSNNNETAEPYDINSTDKHGNTELIRATQNNNLIYVQDLLKIPTLQVNHQNKWLNTALHYAAIKKHYTIIEALLLDHRTDAHLANEYGLRPRDCFIIDKTIKTDAEIRISLFFRAMLNKTVHEESFAMIVDKVDINDIVTAIKDRILANYENQKSHEPLPTGHYLPPYADDEFIQKMILVKVKKKD